MSKVVSVSEAAAILNVTPKTVRRRIKHGKLKANLVNGQYEVELPGYEAGQRTEQGTRQNVHATGQSDYTNSLLDRIKSLEVELEARRMEVLQLHALLSRPQLPGPSWWQRLFGRRRAGQ
jgi:methylphosphotriester-DNA--protein-cysteine methyltransferase